MDEALLRVLEFPRVCEHLSSYCASGLGRRAAAELVPGIDPAKIERAHALTVEIRHVLEEGTRVPLGGVYDLGPVLESLHRRGSPVEEAEILRFKDTLEASVEIRRFFTGRKESAPIAFDLVSGIPDLDSLLGRFDLTVDRRGQVRDEASPRLGEIRHERRTVESRVEAQIKELLANSSIRVVLREAKYFYRNGRYVLPVKAESRGHVRGMIHDSSQSGQTLFVEPEETVPLGNRLGDLRAQERREVTRILWEITRDLLDVEADLLRVFRILAEIDLTFGKAKYAIEHDLHPAEVAADRVMLRGARHPLLLMMARARSEEAQSDPDAPSSGEVVPIDVRLGEDFDLLIVTGPNTGGKTVTLKTVGLLVLMNQAGLPIPAARGSSLPIYGYVGADIGDEQSIEQSLSTFSGHMVNIRGILEKTGERCLILLDELGAGTDPAEGAALGIGILDRLREQGAHALVTTHIGSLKTYAYENPRARNASVEFDVESLSPTYRLLIGQPGNSNAVTIARRIGLPTAVLERASAILAGESDGTESLASRLTETLREAESRAEETEQLREESRAAAEESKRIRGDLARRRDILQRETDFELEQRLLAIRAALEPHLNVLLSGPESTRAEVERLIERIDTEIQGTPLAQKREDYIRKLKKEQQVMVPKYRQQGRVQRVNRSKRTVSVVIGAMTLEVPFEEISVPDDQLRESR